MQQFPQECWTGSNHASRPFDDAEVVHARVDDHDEPRGFGRDLTPSPFGVVGVPSWHTSNAETSAVLQLGVAASTDLFARRNRARIAAVVLISACNYVLSVALAAVTIALSLALLAIFKLEIWPDSVEMLELMGYGIGGICAVAFVIGFFT